MKRGGLQLLIAVPLAVVATLQARPALAQTCVPPPSGLVSWWAGDDNPGDATGDNPGTAENGTTYTPGKVRQAFSFDGDDDFVNVRDSATLDAITTEITVDFWMKPNPEQRWERNMWIFARRDPLISEGFSVLILPDGELVVDFGAGSDPLRGTTTIYQSDPIIRFGEWQHVAVTANTALGQVDAYVDGNPVPLQLVWGPPLSGRLFNVNHLFIGRRQGLDAGEGTVLAGHFAGELDEVELFARVLSQDEIQAIYSADSAGKCQVSVGVDIRPGTYPNSVNLGSRGTVPVAILGAPGVFDALTVDPTTVRLAGAGVALKGNGAPMASLQDVNGDGTIDLVVHVGTEDLQLTASDTMAVLTGMTFGGTTFWGTDSVRIVRPLPTTSCTPPPAGMLSWWRGEDGADSVGSNHGAMLGGATNEPGKVGLAFSFDGSDDFVDATDSEFPLGSAARSLELWVKPAFNARVPFIYGDSVEYDAYYVIVAGPNACIGQWGGWPTEPCGATDVTDGRWHHLALTYDGAIARLYVDGLLEARQKKVYSTTSTGRAYIGSTVASEEYFPGMVDEVTVYGRALKPSEIRSIYASGSSGKCNVEP